MSDAYGSTGGYGAMPGEPMPGTPVVRTAPQDVVWAVWAMTASAVLSIVGLLLVFTRTDEIREALRVKDPAKSAAELDTLTNVSIATTVVVYLIFVVLYLLLSRQVLKGKPWARIVTAVVAGLSLVFGLVGLGAGPDPLELVLQVIGIAINIGILVLLFRKPGNAYFAR